MTVFTAVYGTAVTTVPVVGQILIMVDPRDGESYNRGRIRTVTAITSPAGNAMTRVETTHGDADVYLIVNA